VYEAKTGRQKNSDLIQLLLYMLCLPFALPHYKGRILSGCLVYKNGGRAHIHPEEVNPEFRNSARYWIDVLAAEAPPSRAPSAGECRYCDITAIDCDDRIEEALSSDVASIDWEAI
jgi:hypothetical protein